MMIKVYLDYGASSDLVAVFADEETYAICTPYLNSLATLEKATIVESVTEEDINDYEETDKG